MVQTAYLGETIIYVFFGSYQYIPKIIKHDTFFDSNMGALTSNLMAVPVFATLITTFQFHWIGIFFFTGVLTGIEWLFVKLQIFSHNWWRIENTVLGLLGYFYWAKVLYKFILHPLKGTMHSLFLLLCVAPILGTIHILPIMWLSNRYYRPGWFENIARDTTAFASIYYMCVSILIVVLVKTPLKNKWWKYVILSASLYAVTIILKEVGILLVLVWWDPWLYVIFPVVALRIAETISKRLTNGPCKLDDSIQV